jgi:hypothetical protein
MNKYVLLVGALAMNILINIFIKRYFMSLNIDWETISTNELYDFSVQKYLLMAVNNFTVSVFLFLCCKKQIFLLREIDYSLLLVF